MAKRKKRKVWPIVLVNGELTRAARRALRPARLEREIAMCHMKVVAYTADFHEASNVMHENEALSPGVYTSLIEAWHEAKFRADEAQQLLEKLRFEQQRRARAASLQKYVDGVYKAVAERESKGASDGQSPHRS